jgi:hypothetical protein
MTHQEMKHAKRVLMLKTSGYPTEGTDGTLRIKDERVLGPGYTTVSTLEEIASIYPHLKEELTHG